MKLNNCPINIRGHEVIMHNFMACYECDECPVAARRCALLDMITKVETMIITTIVPGHVIKTNPRGGRQQTGGGQLILRAGSNSNFATAVKNPHCDFKGT
jgi:hypothetical protein